MLACGCGASALPPKPAPPRAHEPPTSVAPWQAPPRPALSTTVGALPRSLVGHEWETLPTASKVVAPTFDAGSNDAGVSSILQTLRRSGTPATFFLTGRWVDAYADEARTIAQRYSVGNHTFDHRPSPQLTDAQVREELGSAARAIRAQTGADPRPLFRFPYGDRDARTIRLVNQLGYGSIRWTVDTLGWQGAAAGGTQA